MKGNLKLGLIVGIIGILLLLGGLYKVLSPQAKVSQTFIDKYNEAASMNADLVAALKTDLSIFEQIDQKDKTRDYSGIVKLVDNALSQNSNVAGKTDLHKQRISELRSLSSQISDLEVKNKALALISLMEEEDIHITKGFENQKQLLEMLRSYYNGLATGKSVSFPASADSLITQTTAEGTIITDLADKLVSARDDFFKVAGLEKK